jgi:uncharacterized protein (DUF1501 family)
MTTRSAHDAAALAGLCGASRRMFLRQAANFSLLGGAAPLALNLAAIGNASAQSATDYKALVCLFLAGGNDAYNTVLATDAASWANYSTVRNQLPDSIALLAPGTPAQGSGTSPTALGGVLAISPANAQGRSFALHPRAVALKSLFDTNKRLAVVANVGSLIRPTTKADYANAAFPKPASLYSHNDQTSIWQSLSAEGATRGWGGRMADLLASQNGKPIFSAISAAGNAVWLSGDTVRQYQVSTGGAIRMGSDSNGRVFGSTAVAASLARVVGGVRGSHVLETDIAGVAQRSIDAELALRGALKAPSDALFGTAPASGNYNPGNDPKLQYDSPLTGGKAFNALAQQLQIVARMIDAAGNAAIGARRQVFFVSLGGFDNHDLQNRNHADLMSRLSHALGYFDTSLGAMGARNQVTLFTASDFGRTFTSNGDGTDHGWGAHHLVMGGAVKGGDLYGTFPVLGAKNANNNNFDSSPDQLGNGALLPTIAIEQYAATMGRWFGVSDSQLTDIFPNLANFSARDLGFMV